MGNKTLCFPGVKVVDLSWMLPTILAKHPSLQHLVVHIGANDVYESEALRRNLTALLTTLKAKGPRIVVSGPIPTHGKGDMRWSRHFHLHGWFSRFCTANSLTYVDNFQLFTPHLPQLLRDGLHLVNEGTQLLASNIGKAVDA